MTNKNPFEIELRKEEIPQHYRENWGRRTIGPEQEYPMVNLESLESVDLEELGRLYKTLEGMGWKPYSDDQTGQVVAVKKEVAGYNATITTDFGTGTLEINYPYGDDLVEIARLHRGILKDACDAAAENGLGVLGYAIQPLTPPSSELVAAKGRYQTLNARFWTTERLKPTKEDPRKTDVHYHTINAADQIHIGLMDEPEAINAVNGLNALAPVLISLCANSPVWQGRIDPEYIEPRELFWDWVVNVPQDQNRRGVPRKFSNLEDYLAETAKLEPVMTARIVNGKARYCEHYGNKTLAQYLTRGRGEVYLPGSVDRKAYDHGDLAKATANAIRISEGGEVLSGITPLLIDLYAHDSFVWYDARLKAEYGTVEIRSCGQQPPMEDLCVAALGLGIVESIDKAASLVEGATLEDIKQARLSAIRHGMKGVYMGMPLKALGEKLVDIAHAALAARGKGEEGMLEPLYRRLESGKNPADMAIEAYSRGGLRALVEERLIRP
jgi:glutamate--cysteine ligase